MQGLHLPSTSRPLGQGVYHRHTSSLLPSQRLSAATARRAGTVVVRVTEPQQQGSSSSSNVSVSQLHSDLLREIEERRKSQTELLDKLNRLAQQSQQITSAQPATPAYYEPTPSLQVPLFTVSAPVVPPQPTYPTQYEVPALPSARMQPEVYIEPAMPFPDAVQDPSYPSEADKPPPLAGPNVMNVVMVGAECAPWSKTGGLGDVMGALPKALARRGHRVMCVAPRYANYPDAWETGVRINITVFNGQHEVGFFHSYRDGVDYVFVDHPCFHSRGKDIYAGDRLEILFRCTLLCKAALESVWHVPCGGVTYGDDNLAFVANDWHTALLPVFLQAHYRDYGKMQFARCTFVIHNMAHQGRGPFVEADNLELNETYKERFRLYDPIGGEHMNIMKVGLQTSHRIVAVSHGYAWECQTVDGGWGLHDILKEENWKLRGIVNGIDYSEWSPQVDEFLKSDGYTNYDMNSLEAGKATCKAALQRELGLPVDPTVPLLGFIGRLDYQKGVDLIRDNYDWLMSERCQLVLLGSGREDLESALRDMENRNKGQCRAWVGFSVKMAHRITAGADMLLMPSRFEPCGLNQLYAMAYGTVPVVHAVGGLRDTVKQFNPYENSGTGWTFDRAEPARMRETVGNALYTWRAHRESFYGIMRRGMEQDLSWDNAAAHYEEVFLAAKYQW